MAPIEKILNLTFQSTLKKISQELFFLDKAENVGKNISDIFFAKSLYYRKLGQSGYENNMLKKARKLCGEDKYQLVKDFYDRICPSSRKIKN